MKRRRWNNLVSQFNIFGAVLLIACGAPVCMDAADEHSPDDWDIHIGLPLWASGIENTLGVGDREAKVDEEFSDIVDILDFAAGLNLELRKSRWLFFANGLYVKISTDAEPGGSLSGLVSKVKVAQKEFDLDFGLGYNVVPGGRFSFEPFVGGRMEWVDVKLSADLPSTERSASHSTAWADPIFGAIATYRFGPHFALFTEADVGGFGVSSDLTWQVNGGLEWNFLRWPYFRLSYRHQSTDFENGGFKFDIEKSGPQLELGLRF